jgi:hypothetical protein
MTQNFPNSSKNSQTNKLFCNKNVVLNGNVIDFNGVDRKSLIDFAKRKGLERIPKTHKATRALYTFLCNQMKNTDNLYCKQETIIKKIEEKTSFIFSRFTLTRANKELRNLNLCMIVQRGCNKSNMYFPNVELFIDDYRRSLEKPDITCDPLDVTFTTQYTNPKGLDKSNSYEDNLSTSVDRFSPVAIDSDDMLMSQTIDECKRRFSLSHVAVVEKFEEFVEGMKALQEKEGRVRLFNRFQWNKYFVVHIRKERALRDVKGSQYIAYHRRKSFYVRSRLNETVESPPTTTKLESVSLIPQQQPLPAPRKMYAAPEVPCENINPATPIVDAFEVTAGAVYDVKNANDQRNRNHRSETTAEDEARFAAMLAAMGIKN